jgi:hypothetical protein
MTQTISRVTADVELSSLTPEQEFAPIAPTIRVAPELIGPDTWLIHSAEHFFGQPGSVYLNSMVIAGEEPVIVDTGTACNRRQWLDDVFGIVDPEDVRWVFLSHDDHDHTGNLAEVLSMCRNATLVTNWAMVERISNAYRFPIDRMNWVNDGDSFDAGSHRLLAVRPPNFDSPTTRGLFDQKTGIYWAVDSFATPCPGEPAPTVADLDLEFWRGGLAAVAHVAVSAWLPLADPAKFAANVDRIRGLGMTTIAAAHSPLITGNSVSQAFELIRDLPSTAPPPLPDQKALTAILSGMAA